MLSNCSSDFSTPVVELQKKKKTTPLYFFLFPFFILSLWIMGCASGSIKNQILKMEKQQYGDKKGKYYFPWCIFFIAQ